MLQRFLILVSFTIFSAANGQTLQLDVVCSLPGSVEETSALENGPDGCFWTHNDSGNSPTLYCVDTLGNTTREVTVNGVVNTDWEELAKSNNGTLYVGDFGNNSLNRTDLRIHIIPEMDTNTVNADVEGAIEFSFPDQYNYPPNGDYGNFDMEAMLWWNDTLHLFSKDRSLPNTEHTKRYKLPATAGSYVAELVDSFQTGTTSFLYSITAADISEDGSQMVLLNADHIWLFSNYSGTDFFGGSVQELNLGTFTQKEGVCFRNGHIYITDEDSFVPGGKLYRVNPGVFVDVAESREEIQVQAIYNSDYEFERVQLPETVNEFTWQLFSVNGRLLKSKTSNKNVLKRKSLPAKSGMYVLHIQVENNARKALLIKL